MSSRTSARPGSGPARPIIDTPLPGRDPFLHTRMRADPVGPALVTAVNHQAAGRSPPGLTTGPPAWLAGGLIAVAPRRKRASAASAAVGAEIGSGGPGRGLTAWRRRW